MVRGLNGLRDRFKPNPRPDLMWSDPDDIENWAVSPRGAGWLFGGSVTQEVRVIVASLGPTS